MMPDDPAMRDHCWVGYHPRALAPGLLLLGSASLLVWTGHWYLEDLTELTDAIDDWLRFVLAWAGWPALAALFLYRTVTYTYRLTDRCLLVDFGPLSRPVPPIPWAEVATVAAGGWSVRWLGIGWVEVRTRAGRVIRLTGVRAPDHLAEMIRAAVHRHRPPQT